MRKILNQRIKKRVMKEMIRKVGIWGLVILAGFLFMICDRPFDVPAQWGHCYRLFWSAALFKIVASRAGILSILVMSGILLYKRYRKACEHLEV